MSDVQYNAYGLPYMAHVARPDGPESQANAWIARAKKYM